MVPDVVLGTVPIERQGGIQDGTEIFSFKQQIGC